MDAPTQKKKKTEAQGYKQRLKDFSSWMEVTNMDRFVILVFLTAEEKRRFAKAQLGDETVDYFDGDDVESIKLKGYAINAQKSA